MDISMCVLAILSSQIAAAAALAVALALITAIALLLERAAQSAMSFGASGTTVWLFKVGALIFYVVDVLVLGLLVVLAGYAHMKDSMSCLAG